MLAGFYGITKFILKQAARSQKDDREERIALVKAIGEMAESSQAVADAVTKQAEEAAIRNGHLGEQNIQITKLIVKSEKNQLKAIRNIKEQKVEHQTVKLEHVESKE